MASLQEIYVMSTHCVLHKSNFLQCSSINICTTYNVQCLNGHQVFLQATLAHAGFPTIPPYSVVCACACVRYSVCV